MTTIYKGITVPDLTDPPNAPAQLRAMVDTGGAVPRFATIADARAAFPAGQRPLGMIVAIGGTFYTSDGTDFVAPIQGGGVIIFDTVAARDAAIPAPALGTMCFVKTFPWSPLTYSTFIGTGTNRWVGSIPYTGTWTTNASGDVIVNFPTLVGPGGAPFSAAPIVSGIVDLNSSGAWNVNYGIGTGYPNGAGFIMGARNSTGSGTTVRASSVCKINFVATGPVG